MTNPAVISGQLVDVRNIATDKSIRLSIHVPAELAAAVIECFGWPTGVDPVPVAIARLAEGKEGDAPENGSRTPDTRPRVASEQPRGAKSPAQMAGILCNDPRFQRFLQEEAPSYWKLANGAETDEIRAAIVVRTYCKVDSRADITVGNGDWSRLLSIYRGWEISPRAGL